MVYDWQRRLKADGLLVLSTHPRERTLIATRVSVLVMMEGFQLLDNNPLLGHYWVKIALDALGYRYGHTTVWQDGGPRRRRLKSCADMLPPHAK